MVKITYLGHTPFKIESPEGKVMYSDPWISGNPACPIGMKDIGDVDIVCVSHGHYDHLGDAIEIVKEKKAKLICSPDMAFYAEKRGIPYDESLSFPINIGGSIKVDGIKTSMTFATHITETYGKEWFEDKKIQAGSGAAGYVWEFEDGTTFYYSGDTGLFSDMQLIGETYRPHVALLPIGGRYNMGPEAASKAVKWISPEKIIPMHFDTFPEIEQNVENFQKLIDNRTRGVEVVHLEPGESYRYPEEK